MNGKFKWSPELLKVYKEIVRQKEIQTSLIIAFESNMLRLETVPPNRVDTHKFFLHRTGEWTEFQTTVENSAYKVIQRKQQIIATELECLEKGIHNLEGEYLTLLGKDCLPPPIQPPPQLQQQFKMPEPTPNFEKMQFGLQKAQDLTNCVETARGDGIKKVNEQHAQKLAKKAAVEQQKNIQQALGNNIQQLAQNMLQAQASAERAASAPPADREGSRKRQNDEPKETEDC